MKLAIKCGVFLFVFLFFAYDTTVAFSSGIVWYGLIVGVVGAITCTFVARLLA